MDKQKINELAAAIYEDFAPWERNFTVEEIAETLESDPLEVVRYLVDRFIKEVQR